MTLCLGKWVGLLQWGSLLVPIMNFHLQLICGLFFFHIIMKAMNHDQGYCLLRFNVSFIDHFLYTGLWQGMGDCQTYATWTCQVACKWQLKDLWTWFLFVLIWTILSSFTVTTLMRVRTLTQPVDVKICSARIVSVAALGSRCCFV